MPATLITAPPVRDELHEALLARAVVWAREIGAVALIGPEEPLAEAVGRTFAAGLGPVLVLAPTVANLSAFHARGAVGDLAEGCDVTVGSTFDGGWYLTGLARPLPELLGADGVEGGRPALFARAAELGLFVGLLRPERGLATPADVRAARADPLFPAELRPLLGEG